MQVLSCISELAIEATTHHKEGGFEVKIVASVPNDTVVVSRKGEIVRPSAYRGV